MASPRLNQEISEGALPQIADPEAEERCNSRFSNFWSKTSQTNAPDVRPAVPEPRKEPFYRGVRSFSPSWFSVTMGTGISSILLYSLPFNTFWIRWIAAGIFALNILVFVSFLLLTILRYVLFTEIWGATIQHPVQSLYFGTFPMGLATIVEMIVYVCVPVWGSWIRDIAWALWWFDAALSLAVGCIIPFLIMTHHKIEIQAVTAAWILPLTAPIVAAGTGGVVAESLADSGMNQWALRTLVVSYFLWGCGAPLALAVLVIYFQRLTIHKLPPRRVIATTFLPLLPLGQAGFGIQQLGKVAMKVIPVTGALPTAGVDSGSVLHVLGWMIALIMWSYGIVWLVFALASLLKGKFEFNMTWWCFIFPLGAFAANATALGQNTPSLVFDVIGTALSLITVLLWAMISILTVMKTFEGETLLAPELQNLRTRDNLS